MRLYFVVIITANIALFLKLAELVCLILQALKDFKLPLAYVVVVGLGAKPYTQHPCFIHSVGQGQEAQSVIQVKLFHNQHFISTSASLSGGVKMCKIYIYFPLCTYSYIIQNLL